MLFFRNHCIRPWTNATVIPNNAQKDPPPLTHIHTHTYQHKQQTLGSVTTVCSDKTGTITEGVMRARLLWAPKGHTLLVPRPLGAGAAAATGLARVEGGPAVVPEALTSGAGAISAPKPEAVKGAVGQVCCVCGWLDVVDGR